MCYFQVERPRTKKVFVWIGRAKEQYEDMKKKIYELEIWVYDLELDKELQEDGW